MVPFYDPRIFERVNLAVLDIFDRVEINRYNADGTIRKKIRVPLVIHFSKNFADFILNTQDKPESKHTTPILGLRMGGLERNPTGTTSRVYQREIYDKASKQIIQDMRPSPWIQTYTLTSYTELIQDHFQILEQIAPYFNPVFNTAIKEFEFSDLKRDLIVELVSVQPQYNDDIDREKARSYICEYTLKVKFDMYCPFYIGTIIERINTRIAASGENIELIQNTGYDNMTIEQYNAYMTSIGQAEKLLNEIVDEGKNVNSVVASTIESTPTSSARMSIDVSSDSVVLLTTIPAGKTITSCTIEVNTVFNATGATVSIGTKTLPSLVMTTRDSNLSLNTKYTVENSLSKCQGDTPIYIYYNSASATNGNLSVEINWA